jgi:hypothetical protein
MKRVINTPNSSAYINYCLPLWHSEEYREMVKQIKVTYFGGTKNKPRPESS